MLNLILIGGSRLDKILDNIDTEKYNVTHTFEYVEDAFDSIMSNGGTYLDTDVMLVLDYGFKSNVDIIEQITSIQEVIEVSDLRCKLYFFTKDKELYDTCSEESTNVIKYDKTRIVYEDTFSIKNIEDLIDGKYDTSGIGSIASIEDDELYTEDILEEEEVVHEPKFEVKTEQKRDESIQPGEEVQVRERPKKGFPLLGKKDKNKEEKSVPVSSKQPPNKKEVNTGESKRPGLFNKDRNMKKSTFERVDIKSLDNIKGVIAVTGDRQSGVSTTAHNIAEICASNGSRVLLIDADNVRRTQSTYYGEFEEAERVFINTQLGLYTVLNNPNMIADVQVVPMDNLALISMSRESKFKVKTFADKKISELLNSRRMTSLIGVAKGMFDVVVIDLPMEQMKELIESTIIIDKFIICCENSVTHLGNLVEISMSELLDTDETYTRSILDKSVFVLTKFSPNSKYDGKTIDEKMVEEILKNSLYNRIRVVGRINYSEVFHMCVEKDKRANQLRQETLQEYVNIINSINY